MRRETDDHHEFLMRHDKQLPQNENTPTKRTSKSIFLNKRLNQPKKEQTATNRMKFVLLPKLLEIVHILQSLGQLSC